MGEFFPVVSFPAWNLYTLNAIESMANCPALKTNFVYPVAFKVDFVNHTAK